MYDARLDFLKELGNIGTGHATTALSQMLQGKLFQLVVPDARMLPFEEAAVFIGGLEQVVAGIFVAISGDVSGHMAFILPIDSAMILVRLLTSDDSGELNEMGLSALQEMGNIMITSYLNALATMTNMVITPSVPGVAVDMAGAVWQSVLAGAQVANEVTIIRTDFYADGSAIEVHIIFLPDEEDFVKIARVMGLEEI